MVLCVGVCFAVLQDDLERLRGRNAAAALLLAASRAAASLLLQLAAVEAQEISACGLLDALIGEPRTSHLLLMLQLECSVHRCCHLLLASHRDAPQLFGSLVTSDDAKVTGYGAQAVAQTSSSRAAEQQQQDLLYCLFMQLHH